MGNSASFHHSRPPSAACDWLMGAPEPSGPDHDRTRAKYCRLARRYDRFISGVGGRVAGFDRQRARAVEKLDLPEGDVVIDVGCGTGLSFALIEQRIGPCGRVFGVELSPEMLAVARGRVEQHGWSNVTLIESSVEEAKVAVEADAALLASCTTSPAHGVRFRMWSLSSNRVATSVYWAARRCPATRYL